jgi:prephenate dehydrogenase
MQTLIGKMKINIAGGSGIMGRIHRPVFESAGHEVIISGRTSSPSLEEAAQISDLTIVTVPIPVTEKIIKRVAPYCSAIMDFTTWKSFPIKAMLEYSKGNCEVGGLHPLYGDVLSIKGRTVVYCPTDRSGYKCKEIIASFEKYGLKIKKMEPRSHDSEVVGITQKARIELLEAFAILIEQHGLSVKELYEVSPPPTKILLDLIARQADEKNDELYRDIMGYDPSTEGITRGLIDALNTPLTRDTPSRIRALFGENFLKEAQESAKALIEQANR